MARPHPLTLQTRDDQPIVCKVNFDQPVGKGILMVNSSPIDPLPASVLLQPMVVPTHAVNVNSFRILVQDQSRKETTIPVGIVLCAGIIRVL